jgi:hypothetical protein
MRPKCPIKQPKKGIHPKQANTMDILGDWAILEADFTREYSIDLTTARLSWRRFLILANQLSSKSNWVLVYDGRAKGTVAIEDDDAGERAVFRNF